MLNLLEFFATRLLRLKMCARSAVDTTQVVGGSKIKRNMRGLDNRSITTGVMQSKPQSGLRKRRT
jgi:hypothetical protein